MRDEHIHTALQALESLAAETPDGDADTFKTINTIVGHINKLKRPKFEDAQGSAIDTDGIAVTFDGHTVFLRHKGDHAVLRFDPLRVAIEKFSPGYVMLRVR